MTGPVKWHEGPMVGFDLETTGTNPHDDRIVTAAVVHRTPGQRPRTLQWLIHPQRDVPTDASDVHGWTLPKIEATLRGSAAAWKDPTTDWQPVTRDGALGDITGQLALAMGRGVPVVACNAAFDLTLVDTEAARHGVDPIASRPAGVTGVVDPMVIEKQYDPYRKVKTGCRGGKHRCGGCGAVDKKLGSLCAHYGVRLTGAHDACADALAGIRLAVRLAGLWPEVARWRLGTLHQHQVTWRREQMDGLRAYFDRAGTEHDGCCGEWPVHRDCAPALVGGGVR